MRPTEKAKSVGPHRPKAEPHWSKLGEKTSTAGIRILLFVAKYFGIRPFRLILKPVLFFYWSTNTRLRRDLLAYQERVVDYLKQRPWIEVDQPDAVLHAGARPDAKTALAQLERFGETILDKLLAACGAHAAKRQLFLEVAGDEPFAADPPNQGAVILTSHAGCQELLSRESRHHTDHPLVVLEHTGHAKRFNELLENASRSDGSRPAAPRCEFFEVTELSPALAMALADRVEQGAYIILAGDRTPIGSEKAVAEVDFLGAKAPFPTGGALLALLLKCPLRMMTCTRRASISGDPPGSARYRVKFASLDESPAASRREREAWLKRMAQAYADNLAAEILRSPRDWFNFYDFWGESQSDETVCGRRRKGLN